MGGIIVTVPGAVTIILNIQKELNISKS